MSQILDNFIGKDCIINLCTGGTADGTVRKISEGWLEIEDKKGKIQAVNADYISKIREYPTSKSGKRKTVIE
ncbi:MAG: hypothetical protein LUG85_08480 [Clostridiales bacterium]|nr:hypothetical protein [Clostridiales bacterium]